MLIILMHEGRGTTKIRNLIGFDSLTIDENLAFVDVVHSTEQFQGAALPAPVLADDDNERRRGQFE